MNCDSLVNGAQKKPIHSGLAILLTDRLTKFHISASMRGTMWRDVWFVSDVEYNVMLCSAMLCYHDAYRYVMLLYVMLCRCLYFLLFTVFIYICNAYIFVCLPIISFN